MTPSPPLLEIPLYLWQRLPLTPVPLLRYPDPVSLTFLYFETIGFSPLHCIVIRFKLSPFFQVDQIVSTIAECPGTHR